MPSARSPRKSAFAQPGNDRLRDFRSASNRPVCIKLALSSFTRPIEISILCAGNAYHELVMASR